MTGLHASWRGRTPCGQSLVTSMPRKKAQSRIGADRGSGSTRPLVLPLQKCYPLTDMSPRPPHVVRRWQQSTLAFGAKSLVRLPRSPAPAHCCSRESSLPVSKTAKSVTSETAMGFVTSHHIYGLLRRATCAFLKNLWAVAQYPLLENSCVHLSKWIDNFGKNCPVSLRTQTTELSKVDWHSEVIGVCPFAKWWMRSF